MEAKSPMTLRRNLLVGGCVLLATIRYSRLGKVVSAINAGTPPNGQAS